MLVLSLSMGQHGRPLAQPVSYPAIPNIAYVGYNRFSAKPAPGSSQQTLTMPSAVASTKLFGISVLVSDHDCDKQPSYEYCGEGTSGFRITVKQPAATVC